MKLLAISRAYGTSAGGMERLSYELINELKKSGEVEVVALTHGGSRASSPLFVLTCLPKALRLARKVDVVHLGDPMLSLVGWLIMKVARKPVAVHVHGLDVTYQNPLYRLYLSLFFRHFSAYFPISQAAKQALEPWHVTGTVTVLPPGIHDVWYDPSRTREELLRIIPGLAKDSVVLLTVGRLVKRKGHAWFIEQVLPQLPSRIHYLIIGDGPERSAIEATAKKVNVSDRVHLLGRVNNETLKVLYNTVDAFIQPNIPIPGDLEGFGLVMLEAASAGRPVFAANIDGIPDAIHDGKNGRLLPVQDENAWTNTLNLLLQNFIGHSNRTQSRAYTLERFEWATLVTHIKDLLGDLTR